MNYFQNSRGKKEKRISILFIQQLYLASRLLESHPSLTHYLPVNCEHRAGCVCVCGCVCLSHTLAVIYSSSHTLPFCLLVNCHGEGGYNGWLRSTINLDTSYHCLPLQGEARPVANMINLLPLCPQPPAHTSNLHPPSPNNRPCCRGKNRASFTPQRQHNLPDLPSLPYTGNN